MVGWTTNALGMWLIFEPVRPKRILGVKTHGLFLRRQDEAAEVYARAGWRLPEAIDRIYDPSRAERRCERRAPRREVELEERRADLRRREPLMRQFEDLAVVLLAGADGLRVVHVGDGAAAAVGLAAPQLERGTGDLVARTTNDVNKLQHAVRFGVPR